MRRPSPLPPPPAEVATRTQIDEPDARDEAEIAGPEDAEAEASLAPVTPLTDSGMSRPDPSALATAAVPDESASEADPEIGLRDVWRAARARRKALRTEVRRFTARQRRRRLTWLGSIAALVVLVIGTLAAAYSPLFGVEQISVVGAEQLDAAAVEESLAGQLGTPLPLVDESAVKAALVGFPLVETYTLEARPPHELVVRIVERTPIGSIESRAGFTLVDAAGVALSTSPAPAEGFPVIDVRGGTGSSAFTALGLVLRSLPEEIRAQVTAASAATPDDVGFTFGSTGARVMWGGADDSAMKAIVLEQAMTARPGSSLYDVSSPRAVVVR